MCRAQTPPPRVHPTRPIEKDVSLSELKRLNAQEGVSLTDCMHLSSKKETVEKNNLEQDKAVIEETPFPKTKAPQRKKPVPAPKRRRLMPRKLEADFLPSSTFVKPTSLGEERKEEEERCELIASIAWLN